MGKEIVDVTVITPSLPERDEMLERCIRSVKHQDVLPEEQLIRVDLAGVGPARLRTSMLDEATTGWVAFLDDDDLLYPHHIETLWNATIDDDGGPPDVVISYCDFIGDKLPDGYYNRPFDRRVLRKHGIFPITVLARRSAILKHGAFRVEDRYEDWALWNRMADGGCKFVTLEEVTWTYDRSGHANRTAGTA